MFQQIVSHLSITPQAVNQLVFYGRRLSQEDITRKLSAFFAVLLVGLQIAVIAAPPSPANAADPNDVIHGGFDNKADFLSHYDAKNQSGATLRDLLTYMGISRADIANKNTKEGTINSLDGWPNHPLLSVGRTPHSGDVDWPSGNKKLDVDGSSFYLRPLHVWDTGANVTRGSDYPALVGTRSNGGFFALMNACGNVVVRSVPKPVTTTPTPSTPPPSSFSCTKMSASPTSGKAPLTVSFTGTGYAKNDSIKEYVWDFGDGSTASTVSAKTSHTYKKAGSYTAKLRVKDAAGKLSPQVTECTASIGVNSTPGPSPSQSASPSPSYSPPPVTTSSINEQKSALNLTQLTNGQPTNATTVTAQPGDTIRYTLTTVNSGNGTENNFVVSDDVTDILEYATITDLGGAALSTDANGAQTISWPAVNITPGTALVRQFTIAVKNPVPATAQGVSNKDSFDLKMDNVYGNGVTIPVATPAAKVTEAASQNLPQTGAGTDALIVFAFGGMVMYFWARNRQLMAEVKILRSDYQ